MLLGTNRQREQKGSTIDTVLELHPDQLSAKSRSTLYKLTLVFFPLTEKFLGSVRKMGARLGQYGISFSERRVLLMTVDTLLLFVSLVAARIFFEFAAGSSTLFLRQTPLESMWPLYAVSLVGGWWLLAALHDLYDVTSSYNRTASALRVVSVGALALVIYQLIYLFWPIPLPQPFFFCFLACSLLLMILWRLAYATLSLQISSPQRVLILGAGKRGQAIAQLLQQASRLQYQVVGYIDEAATVSQRTLLGLPVLGQINDLPRLVQQFAVDEVIIAANHDVTEELFQNLVGCLAQDIRVSSMSALYEQLHRYIPVHHIDPTWALYAVHNQPILNRLRRFGKRAFDLAVVLLTLPLLGALLPPLMLAIRLDSSGPIFYRQVRSGRGGKPFSIYKFRTMVTDAEKDGKPRWAVANDPRITRVGWFLRKTRLDELPQILNILKGEMSIVGPRPERPEFIEELQKKIPFYQIRLMVKPGLTGWAQIHYNYGNSVEDALLKLQYDFYYIRYWSLWMDLYIMFKTVYVVFMCKGL